MALEAGAPQFYTVAEVAEITRVSRMTIYRMVHSGSLPAVRVGSSYRVPASALNQLVMGAGDADSREQRAAQG